MMNVKDMTKQSFSRLKVIKLSDRKSKAGQRFWICLCACGKYFEVRGDNLRNGNTTQCSRCSGKRNGRSRFIEKVILND